jgi:Carboxypeptidase regulatory-like domain/PDZ domain
MTSSVAARRRMDRAIVFLSALVCLLFAGTLRDTSVAGLWVPQSSAPKLPDSVGNRDAALTIEVAEAQGASVPGALVRVFSIVGDRAYLAATGTTDDEGKIVVDELPRGETWIVADRAGLSRATSRLVLDEPGARTVRLDLHPAEVFEVVVVDTVQRPIRGVGVTLFTSDPLPHRANTDVTGLSHFDGLGPGPYTVEVDAPGFDPVLIERVGPADTPLFIKLERLGSLLVRVRGPDGTPTAGANVLVTGSALWPARSATTNEAGEVDIGGLPRGFYDLRAESGNLVSDALAGVLLERGERKTVDLDLVVGKWVSVIVTDGESDDAPPVKQADVALVEHGLSSFPIYGRTDDEGKVRLGPVATLDATVSARAEGYVARSAVVVGDEDDVVRVPLMRGGKITGVVVDEDGYPIDGAELEVVGVDLYGMPIVESSAISGFREDHFAFALPGATPLIPAGELGVMPIVPDIPRDSGALTVTRTKRTATPWVSRSNGELTLHPVTPGRIRVVAHHPGYVEGTSEPVDLAPGGTAEVKIVLRKGGTLEGRVVEHDGTPARGARIQVLSLFSSLERITYTADDGSFAFAALPSRVIVMVARADALSHVVARETFDIPAERRREVEIVLPEPRDPVTLRVTDERGYPVERVEIHTSSLEADAPLVNTSFSDDEGEATILDARGLPLRIVLTRRGYGATVAEIVDAPARIELALATATAVVGLVESRYGPIAGAAVTVLVPAGRRTAKSDEEGAFRIEDLASGAARLLVVAAGHVPDERNVQIESDGTRDHDLGRIELIEGGTVRGIVLDEEGEPIVGARVALGRVPTYLPLGELPIGVAASGRDGRFSLPDVEPGPASVEAYRVGFGRGHADVEVRAREETGEITIELIEDPDVDVTRVRSQASLAVTLGEEVVAGERTIIFEHIPLGGEAQRAGLLAGDRLVAVDGVPMRSLEQARSRFNGPLGEDIVLTLSRPPDLLWRVRVSRERLRR